jgi:hypothetical protein
MNYLSPQCKATQRRVAGASSSQWLNRNGLAKPDMRWLEKESPVFRKLPDTCTPSTRK